MKNHTTRKQRVHVSQRRTSTGPDFKHWVDNNIPIEDVLATMPSEDVYAYDDPDTDKRKFEDELSDILLAAINTLSYIERECMMKYFYEQGNATLETKQGVNAGLRQMSYVIINPETGNPVAHTTPKRALARARVKVAAYLEDAEWKKGIVNKVRPGTVDSGTVTLKSMKSIPEGLL